MKTKNYLLLLITVLGIGSINSCKKDEPTPTPPTPTADFTYSGANNPAPTIVTFTNTSTNATSYTWDFGDNGTSTDMNPQHLYAAGGVYTVKLTAKGQGGSTSTTKTVNIGSAPTKVKITKVTVTNIPFVNGSGSGWDIASGPDVFFNIIDQASTVLVNGTNSRINDVTPSMLPLSWNFTTPFEITDFNVSRFVDIWDFDTPDADDNIGYVGFIMSDYTSGSNPYPPSVTKTQNGITVTLDLTWQ